jgi:hypothetical protein
MDQVQRVFVDHELAVDRAVIVGRQRVPIDAAQPRQRRRIDLVER